MRLWHLKHRNIRKLEGWCLSLTSTGHSSGGLALKEVGVCSRHSDILLQASVQLHMESILILLLYGPALSILSPFLCTFTQTIRNNLFTLFSNLMTLLTFLIQIFSVIYQQRGAYLHQRTLQTSQEEDGLAVGRAEQLLYQYVRQHPAEKQTLC